MQTEPVVSVIIPVHNGDAYLRECLDSVLAQTLDALEVIVVDDASTDGTPSILASYVESARGKVRLITQSPNQGVSAARNRGIKDARGTFIAFVDADDLVRPRMYAHLVEVADSQQLDVVSCGIQVFDHLGSLATVPYPMRAGVGHDNQEMRVLLATGFSSKLLWFPFRSLYRRSLVEAHGVQFATQIRKGEDSLFNLEVLSRARSCGAVEDAYYLYRKHDASVTARPLPSESGNLEALGDRVTAFFREEGFQQAAIDDFYRYVLASDLPTALVRLAAAPPSRQQLHELRAARHVDAALRRLGSLGPRSPRRLRMLLLLFKHSPAAVADVFLRVRRLGFKLGGRGARRSR